MKETRSILCFATKGAGSNEEDRIRLLLKPLEPELWPFDRSRKLHSALRLAGRLPGNPPELRVTAFVSELLAGG